MRYIIASLFALMVVQLAERVPDVAVMTCEELMEHSVIQALA